MSAPAHPNRQDQPRPHDQLDDGTDLVAAALTAFETVSKTWPSWVVIAQAYVHGRSLAMRIAGTNRPFGKGYQRAYDAWATRTGFNITNKFDAPTRSAMAEIIANLPDIEACRATLTEHQRIRLNHPMTMLRHYKAKTRPKDDQAAPQKPSLKDELHRLKAENDRLHEEIDADPALLIDWERDTATAIIDTLSKDPAIVANPAKAAKVFAALHKRFPLSKRKAKDLKLDQSNLKPHDGRGAP